MGNSTLKRVESTLHLLRRGEVDLDGALEVAVPILRTRAHWLMEHHWLGRAQNLLGADDLVTEMCLELGRAVDRWDSRKCASLAHYCDVQVGRWAERMLREAAGWPDSRRPKKPRVEYMDDLVREGMEWKEGTGSKLEALFQEGFSTRVETAEEAMARMQAVAPRVALLKERFGESFEGRLMALVLEGLTIVEAASAIYANPRLRLAFRLDSEDHAHRAAYNASYTVRRAAEALAA